MLILDDLDPTVLGKDICHISNAKVSNKTLSTVFFRGTSKMKCSLERPRNLLNGGR